MRFKRFIYKEKILKNTAGKFILKNFVKMVLLIFAVSIAAFALMTVSPVDPLQANEMCIRDSMTIIPAGARSDMV